MSITLTSHTVKKNENDNTEEDILITPCRQGSYPSPQKVTLKDGWRSQLYYSASPEARKHTSISRLFSASTIAAPIVAPEDKRATF